ncbi:MAG: electron transfer flavoprotein subunit alpha/FixB family protein [Desulfobacterales bacterium]
MINNVIYVLAEHIEGGIRPVTYEIIAFAKALQAGIDADVTVLLLGNGIDGMAAEIAENTGIDVQGFQHESLAGYNQELYASVLASFFADNPFVYVCMPHSTQGMDLAPVLAVKTGAACITGVEGMEFSTGAMGFYRSVFNGKASAFMVAETTSTVLTVQGGIAKPAVRQSEASGNVHISTVHIPPHQTRSTGIVRARTDSRSIAEADIIISAGRGIGKQENLDLVRMLAEQFSKSAVGGSRPLCDLGWLEYQCQIGITGQSVSPELYVACGISGAVQHLSGIRGAGFIVAINTDPKAAIFNMADVCIVEDATSFIPVLIEALKSSAALSG